VTVIAFKDGCMAADTRLSDYNESMRATKLVRLPDGGVAGACGLWSAAYATLRWLESGGDEMDEHAERVPDMKEASVLIARPGEKLRVIENRLPAFPILDKVASIGCGAAAAKALMATGHSSVQAICYVTKQDILCGDPVQSMEVQSTHEYPAVKTHPKRSPPAKKKR
jgi:hypothetical protein